MPIKVPRSDLPEDCLVDNRIYTDRATFDAERERIFNRVWNFVCHESEVPNPGDYVTVTVSPASRFSSAATATAS